MNSSQLVGLYVAGVAAAYMVIRLLLSMRAARGERKPPAPPDPLAPDLAAMVPALPDTRQDLQKMLWTAGYYRPSALAEFLAVRAVLVVGALLATALLALAAPPAKVPLVIVAGAMAAGLGFSLPRMVLLMQSNARRRRLVHGLPLAMDVIGLCLTAGQNLLGSLEQTSRELARSCPDLSLELQIVQAQARMHSLEQALLHWADRLDVAEVRSLALLLVQSDRLGTDMVNTLLEVADSQRTLLRQRADAQANRANFWMLFPTLFCLWIAAAIILVGPVYIEFWKFRQEQLKALMSGARGQVERSNMSRPAAPAEGESAVTGAAAAPAAPR